MRILITAAVALLISSAAIGAEKKLVQDVAATAAQLLQGSYLCAPIIGDAYVASARAQLEGAMISLGIDGDTAAIMAEDADTDAQKFLASSPPLRSLIGKNGVAEIDIMNACYKQIGDLQFHLRAAVARARKSP